MGGVGGVAMTMPGKTQTFAGCGSESEEERPPCPINIISGLCSYPLSHMEAKELASATVSSG